MLYEDCNSTVLRTNHAASHSRPNETEIQKEIRFKCALLARSLLFITVLRSMHAGLYELVGRI